MRFRLDGVLTQVERLPRTASNGVFSRIKILSDLDISERRRPQDGRMRMRVDGRKVDLRVLVMPPVWGESVVAQVLEHASGSVPLTELGISRGSCKLLEHVAKHPHGLFLVTDPCAGRTVVSELFPPTDLMAATLRFGGEVLALREAAAQAGFEEMIEVGRRKVLAGVTMVPEVLRVNRRQRVSEEESRAA